MKRATLLFLILSFRVIAQTTITLQPGAAGKDCEVWTLSPTTNYVSNFLRGNAWTFNGPFGIERGLFQFDLSSIPNGATILSASLSLFAPDSPTTEFDFPASGSNQAWLQRITSDWGETTVTWDNQPSTTTLNQVFLPESVSYYEDYPDINVSNLIQDMIDSPANSFGFMIKLDTETYYRRLTFCSSDYPDSSKHPKLVITYSFGVSTCEKFCLNFTDPSPGNPTSWLWKFDGGSPDTSIQQNPSNICYDVPGVYNVTLITSDGNITDTLFLTNYVTVNPTPPIPTITQNGYTLTSSSAYFYQWQVNAADIPGATDQSYTVLQSGDYTVVVADSNGCTNSARVYVLISGIDEENNSDRVSFFPNPVSNKLTVKAENDFQGKLSIRITDANGKELMQRQEFIGSSAKFLDVSYLPSGIYFIFVSSGNLNEQKMFVKL
ncbi:MAG: DNRLRE domain-containing protein [Chitinophagales bacterium]